MEHHGGIVLIVSLFFLLCGPTRVNADQQHDCTKVQCPSVDVSPCPADSYRLPTMLDHHAQEGNEASQEKRKCCPEPLTHEKCQCIPGLHCSPECPSGSTPKLVQNATREPGKCCAKFQCIQDAEEEDEIHRGCRYNGHNYSTGETWSHLEDCTECFCHNGVVSCKPIKCDLATSSGCTLARTPPNSCCPVCVGCVTATGGVYNNSQEWEEDPCTTCICNEGRVQCHAAMCHSTCSNPIHIPGECCPRCDLNNPNDKDHHSSSCPFLDCHLKECPHGFKLDKFGCPTCNCLSTVFPLCPDMALCDKHCLFGFQVDEKQCSTCKCRKDLSNQSDHEESSSSENNLSASIFSEEKKLCKISDGVPRYEGEEWADQCRRCICKDGEEMCTLITCHPPNCEHPIFFSGDCCPRCPRSDEEVEHVNFSISVCQSSDGTERLEGETWALGPCLRCTCHSGQVLCSAPECPPIPCPRPALTSPHKCCLTCPTNENTVTTNKTHSNCLSDDSMKSYADGETWKVRACQSCICEEGRIQCYSVGKCPPLKCDRPVLAKNQCCPICLNHHRRTSEAEHPESTLSSSRGMESYCAILIGVVLGLSLVFGVMVFRHCFCRRVCSSSRLIKIKKAPPSFHSSNSSQDTPPVTPDCCYKCDYNKYSSCAQLAEQKPLFNPSSSSGSSGGGSGGNNSDKV